MKEKSSRVQTEAVIIIIMMRSPAKLPPSHATVIFWHADNTWRRLMYTDVTGRWLYQPNGNDT